MFDLQLFAHPSSPQQMATDYNDGVRGVTLEDYCGPQEALGVSRPVCERRFRKYQEKAPNKGTKMVERWQQA